MSANTPPTTDAIPATLTSRDQWVCWRDEHRDGTPTKVPVDPRTGGLASTTDPDTWASFDTVTEALARDDVHGIGFVFSDGDDIVGVDLDDCRDPETGEPDETAGTIIETLDSYTEVSPSGTGYHVLARGQLPAGRNRAGAVEMYESGRFFTVTGAHVQGTPEDLKHRPEALATVHETFLQDERGSAGATATPSQPPPSVAALSDETLLDRAKAAKNGAAFERLWTGDTAGYESHSEADMALCCHLAFWTGGDASRMDRLFRRSGLMREKWDERHYADGSTYGEKTIERAIEVTSEFYDPSAERTERPDRSASAASTHAGAQRQHTGPTDEQVRTRLAAAETTIEHLESKVRTLEAELERLRDDVAHAQHRRTEQDAGRPPVGDRSLGHRVRRRLSRWFR